MPNLSKKGTEIRTLSFKDANIDIKNDDLQMFTSPLTDSQRESRINRDKS
jgi:hypothetical protein